MATIGVYDNDFMQYEHVIPNLECAKLCAYYKQHNQITVLAPQLEPGRYTKMFVRKEYDDGVFRPEFFEQNVIYGGRAFSPEKYVPFDLDIERTYPDLEIYRRYMDNYGHCEKDFEKLNRMINSVNMRFSLDGEKVDDYAIQQCYDNIKQRSGGILIHDYFPGKIENFREIITEISNSRFTLKGKPKPLAIGNKYPIDIYSSEELLKWADIYPMTGIFFLRFHGVIDNEVLVEMIQKNPQFCRQIYYMVDEGCTSEEDFLQNRAIEIYKQVLFCRFSNTRILLKYEEGFFKTPELVKFITLLNCFGNQKWQENFLSQTQTMYKFCSQKLQRLYRDILYRANVINQYDMREIFMYIREHNYELFKMFYEWDKVYLEGGVFKNEWTRN